MALRFRKSIKIAPGVKLNVSKKSTGVSIGGKHGGISVNSKTGAHARVSAPGTGISYYQKIGGSTSSKKGPNNAGSKSTDYSYAKSMLLTQEKLESLDKDAFNEYARSIVTIAKTLKEGDPRIELYNNYLKLIRHETQRRLNNLNNTSIQNSSKTKKGKKTKLSPEEKLSVFSDKQLRTYKKIFMPLGIVLIFLAICCLPIAPLFFFLGLIFGILCIRLSKQYKKELVRRSADNTTKQSSIQQQSDFSSLDECLEIIKEPASKSSPKRVVSGNKEEQQQIYSDIKTEHHRIVGTAARQKEIKSLGSINPCYKYTKKEIMEHFKEKEKVYEYVFNTDKVELIPEPDDFSENSVKVVIDGIHVGYVKKGSCSHIKNLLRDNRIIKINADIIGGKWKEYYYDFDGETEKMKYFLDNNKSDFYVSLYIDVKNKSSEK